MNDRDFLIWIHQRLSKVHGENELVDYMHKLRCIIANTPVDRLTPNSGRGGDGYDDLMKRLHVETETRKDVAEHSAATDCYAPFSRLCLGAKLQYDERTHGLQERVWVKIGHNEIAEWDRSNIATNWVGQQICSFADKDEDVSEVVFIVWDA